MLPTCAFLQVAFASDFEHYVALSNEKPYHLNIDKVTREPPSGEACSVVESSVYADNRSQDVDTRELYVVSQKLMLNKSAQHKYVVQIPVTYASNLFCP